MLEREWVMSLPAHVMGKAKSDATAGLGSALAT